MAKDRFDIKEKEGVSFFYVHRGYGGGLTPLPDPDGKPIITKDRYRK